MRVIIYTGIVLKFLV